jgi:hypothetical protein
MLAFLSYGDGAMPIHAILLEQQHAFAPDEITKIVQGFEEALTGLCLKNRNDPMALMIAKVVFEAAKQGETDPQRLRDIAVKKFCN